MDLVVWNSRGSKWNTFWTNALAPLLPAAEDVMGLLVESGWPPWVEDGVVGNEKIYKFDSMMEYYKESTGAFTVNASGRAHAWWCPWVKEVTNKDGTKRTNTRCSLGIVHVGRNLAPGVTKSRFDEARVTRPMVRVTLDGHTHTKLAIVLVHLVSNRNVSPRVIAALLNMLPRLIPQDVPGFIVGDLNYDLLQQPDPRPNCDHWRLVRWRKATHNAGGELDFGLLYSHSGRFNVQAGVTLVQRYNSGWNKSDHSVLRYTLGIP